MTLKETLDCADSANRELWDAVFSTPFPGEIVTEKTLVLIGFVDTAIEHHSGITLLIRNQHYGSAMALIRSVYEAMYRGVWTVVHASEQNAGKMRVDKFDWPGTGALAAAADKAYGISFFEAAKKGNWQSLNSFTHTGGLQVARRFTQNDLQANYPEDELKHAVTSTFIAAGILAIPFLKAHGRMDEAERVEALLLKFSEDTQ